MIRSIVSALCRAGRSFHLQSCHSSPSAARLGRFLLVILFLLAVATVVSAQTYNYPESTSVSGGGTLNWTLQQQMGYCGSVYQDVTDTFENFSYTPVGGSATGLSGSIYYLYGCDSGYINLPGGWDGPGGGDNELDLSYTYCTVAFDAYIGGGGNASLNCPPLSASTFDPTYKVVSILYSPPGNKSSQGYGTATTNGTTTTISNSFSYGYEETFSSGIKDVLSGSAFWGYTTGTTDTSAFTQTWTNALNYATTDNSNYTWYNPAQTNVLNHLWDTFEIWLNPQITTESYGSTPVSYTANSQPITLDNEQVYLGDSLPVPAVTMQAQPAGVTQMNPSGVAGVSGVPLSTLIPVGNLQENQTYVYQPGLGAICANNALYQQQLAAMQAGNNNAQICTQANQCGCTPADFATIMETNPLLGYNSSTYTANPPSGTETPLAYDASGESVCGFDQPAGYQIPSGSDCRYVIVPQAGTNVPIELPLNGAQSETYTQSDSTTKSLTTTANQSYNVGFSYTAGPLVANLKNQYTWTWTDSEGIGTSTGGTSTMSVTLNTSTANCQENNDLYEDTIYHTYVLTSPNSCP